MHAEDLADIMQSYVEADEANAKRYSAMLQQLIPVVDADPQAFLFDCALLIQWLQHRDRYSEGWLQDILSRISDARGDNIFFNGKEPPGEELKPDRQRYMRDMMRERRRRESRRVEIENMTRPASQRATGKAREALAQKFSREWRERVDRQLDVLREQHKGRLPKPLEQQTREEFWQVIEQELDELERTTREAMLKK